MSDHAEKRAGAPSYTPSSEVAAECVDFLLTEEFHSHIPPERPEPVVPQFANGYFFVYLHPGDGSFTPHLREPGGEDFLGYVVEFISGSGDWNEFLPEIGPGEYFRKGIVIGNPDFQIPPRSVGPLLRASYRKASWVALILPSVFLSAFTDPNNRLLMELVGHKDVSMEWGRDYLHLSFFVFRRHGLEQGPPRPQLPTFKRYKSLDELASSHTPDDIAYQDREYESMKQWLEESRRKEEEEWKRGKK